MEGFLKQQKLPMCQSYSLGFLILHKHVPVRVVKLENPIAVPLLEQLDDVGKGDLGKRRLVCPPRLVGPALRVVPVVIAVPLQDRED